MQLAGRDHMDLLLGGGGIGEEGRHKMPACRLTPACGPAPHRVLEALPSRSDPSVKHTRQTRVPKAAPVVDSAAVAVAAEALCRALDVAFEPFRLQHSRSVLALLERVLGEAAVVSRGDARRAEGLRETRNK